MNQRNCSTLLFSTLLAFFLSVSAVMCPATGFDLSVASPARLIALCALASLGCSILFQIPQGSPIFLLASLLLGILALRLPLFPTQVLGFIQQIGQAYHNAYHWGFPNFGLSPQSADYPLMLLGYLAAAAVSFWVCRGKGFPAAMMTVLLPLISCLVVTDTVPDVQYLFLILAGCGIMILTASVRRQNLLQGNRLAAMAAIPIAAIVAVLFWLVPQQGYVNRSESLRQQLLQLAQSVPRQLENRVSQLSVSIRQNTPHSISLSSLSGQNPAAVPVMTITGESSGTLYLRGRDYDRYTGTGWIASEDRAEVFTTSQDQTADITICTRSMEELLYVPYYPAQETPLSGGAVTNQNHQQTYRFSTGSLSEVPALSNSGTLPDSQLYLALPEVILPTLRDKLESILPESGTHIQMAEAIAAFVRNSADYDLNPGRMPREETDFALWFLEKADRGYCVHFATASAVLLRAAGIPARYVTGYMTTTQPGVETTVTEKDAHAWVEFYEPRLDAWLILESTPAAGSEETTPSLEPETSAAVESTATGPEQAESTPTPSGADSITPQPPEATAADWSRAGYPVGAALALLTLLLQRKLRITLRTRKQTRSTINTQALYRWQEAEFLSRLLKQTPTEELLALAQKARFSNHDLSQAELQQFDGYLRACRQQLRQKPWLIRLIHQYLFAAY